MPNGGSDCCGTCIFNTKNEGKTGSSHFGDLGPSHCKIRDLDIENAFWTYCANHHAHNPAKIDLPIGPVFVYSGGNPPYGRKLWVESPDSEDIRKMLLKLLSEIEEKPEDEYPAGSSRDNIVIWQLGEWQEKRALPDLKRILKFNPETTSNDKQRSRKPTVALVEQAIQHIEDKA